MMLITVTSPWADVPDRAARVDDADFDAVSQLDWRLRTDPGGRCYARHCRRVAGYPVTIYLHRFVMGVTDSQTIVDHKDGDGLNCVRDNLRTATRRQNNSNTSKRRGPLTSSRFKGVAWNRRAKKWECYIGSGKTRTRLGLWADEVSAAHVYDGAAVARYGEFARTNFQRPGKDPLGEARRTGRQAWFDGTGLVQNPHDAGTALWREWAEGWGDGLEGL